MKTEVKNVNDAQWRAIVNCDAAFDGQFFYGVTSTGVFCRPSCRSRTPRRENVRIFHSNREAQAAGFRPCKHCHPETLHFEATDTCTIGPGDASVGRDAPNGRSDVTPWSESRQ
ncbi:Ada metal-binding domain-containing protein [Alicyclobacillus sp.]|uniref:Ada metal-binding domain-containing protein n=1 Tax=Alicyclobacillus sp. TaxID=61169 RepID=UPI0025B91BC2|nr:Ada metal-binding domain-containing protein [Alicyclobacillus sp.]MCL6516792.1 hypothetical protein [Alicyclobacillus sp.]